VKKRLESEGHACVVLNIGTSRAIPSTEYETVMSGGDFVRKLWRYSRQGFVVHAHGNGDALKGLMLAITAELINLLSGQRCYLTFHAGAIQRYFPRHRNRWLIPAYWLLFVIPRRIICNSNAVKECIAGYGISRSKIVAIPAFSRKYMEFTPSPLPTDLETFLGRYPHIVFTYIRMRPLFFPITLVNGMAEVMRRRADVGLVLCGMAGHSDEGVQTEFEAEIQRHGIAPRICLLDDLDHDAFLTVLQRSTLYLRTPITDGVASSVLEALTLGIPVVACENGNRPPGVITYPATDAARLAVAVEQVIEHRAEVVGSLNQSDVPDTVADEVAILTS
jgi:glycosyltransferase involved in cell wall biosynthesis